MLPCVLDFPPLIRLTMSHYYLLRSGLTVPERLHYSFCGISCDPLGDDLAINHDALIAHDTSLFLASGIVTILKILALMANFSVVVVSGLFVLNSRMRALTIFLPIFMLHFLSYASFIY